MYKKPYFARYSWLFCRTPLAPVLRRTKPTDAGRQMRSNRTNRAANPHRRMCAPSQQTMEGLLARYEPAEMSSNKGRHEKMDTAFAVVGICTQACLYVSLCTIVYMVYHRCCERVNRLSHVLIADRGLLRLTDPRPLAKPSASPPKRNTKPPLHQFQSG